MGESPDQFIVRFEEKNNLHRWIELSGASHTYASLSDLFVKEQFINACPRDLKVHIQERAPTNLTDLSDIADKFLSAHNREFSTRVKKDDLTCTTSSQVTEKNTIQCYKCLENGHKSTSCIKNQVKTPGSARQCFRCNGLGHEAKVCPSRRPAQRGGVNAGRYTRGNEASNREVSAGCLVNRNPRSNEDEFASEDEIQSCISGGKVMLSCGKNIPFMNSACVKSSEDSVKNMPVVKGKIGEVTVETLRDTGCSGVVVKKALVKDEQLTGEFGYMMLIDNSVIKVPLAFITVETPFFKGEVEAQCLPDAIYDLIIGNIPGARNPDDPDPMYMWCETVAVTTRAQAKKSDVLKPLRVP